MVQATDLKEKVKAFTDTSLCVGIFSDETQKALYEAKALFELAPDEFIDTGRLPNSVSSLSSLVEYLKTIKEKLEKRDNKTKNEDWDVAKSGQLRLYKLFVCNIHALSAYLAEGKPDFGASPAAFAAAAVIHGKANLPKGLSTKGKTMWEKTFGDSQPRTAATMKTLVFLCQPAEEKKPAAVSEE